jgi:hypothetical protein
MHPDRSPGLDEERQAQDNSGEPPAHGGGRNGPATTVVFGDCYFWPCRIVPIEPATSLRTVSVPGLSRETISERAAHPSFTPQILLGD